MPQDSHITHTNDTPNFAPRFFGIAILVLAIVVTGLWLVGRYNSIDLARDMQSWREKLNLIAESRTSDVGNWVGDNFKELRTLADNPSLQLYMSELQMMKDATQGASESGKNSQDTSQKAYLRNLVLFTAERAGFGVTGHVAAIDADVPSHNKNALAIIDNNNAVVVSTQMPPAMVDRIIEQAKNTHAGKEVLIDVYKDKEGTPYIGFSVPIYSIQGEHNPASQIGHVVGIKTFGDNVFRLLKPPGIIEKTLEVILVRMSGDKIEYLSPLEDGTAALGKTISLGAKTAESVLVKSPGDFISEQQDYRDNTVLATSRQVTGTPWNLIVKIDRLQALATTDERRESMEFFFFLVISIIILIVVSMWWRGDSKRSLLMSEHFQRLADTSMAQEELLRLVSDHQPDAIFMVDRDMRVHFANDGAARVVSMAVNSIAGKTLWDVRGAAQTQVIADHCASVLSNSTIAYDVQRIKRGGKDYVTRSAYVPLRHIPIAHLVKPTEGVLIVEQDISDVIHEREQRLKTQRQVIDTLVAIVDKRDPFAAHHSRLVSQIAYEVAREMELDNVTVETTSKAGSLMNIGKIAVPTELLIKTSTLSSEEKNIIHDSMNAAAKLLEGISFDGPVTETLRQWQEKWDGSGPLGMKGNDILISARIIGVVNAFVAMISPRSWRPAMTIESATKFLIDQAEIHFDRRVVIALANFIENHNGREMIEQIMTDNKKIA